MVGTETGDLSLTTKDTYNYKAWHHIAMTRTDDVVQLWVHGTKVAEGETPAGSITRGGELLGIDGIFLGQRLDGNNKLGGDLDGVRVYDTALDGDQIGALADGKTKLEADSGLRLRLPLDQIVEEGGETNPPDATERLSGLSDSLRNYVDAGDVSGPIVDRLTRDLQKAEKHAADRPGPGRNALDKFIRDLGKEKKGDSVTESARKDLKLQAEDVLEVW